VQQLKANRLVYLGKRNDFSVSGSISFEVTMVGHTLFYLSVNNAGYLKY
jgi:hypothetical protein